MYIYLLGEKNITYVITPLRGVREYDVYATRLYQILGPANIRAEWTAKSELASAPRLWLYIITFRLAEIFIRNMSVYCILYIYWYYVQDYAMVAAVEEK